MVAVLDVTFSSKFAHFRLFAQTILDINSLDSRQRSRLSRLSELRRRSRVCYSQPQTDSAVEDASLVTCQTTALGRRRPFIKSLWDCISVSAYSCSCLHNSRLFSCRKHGTRFHPNTRRRHRIQRQTLASIHFTCNVFRYSSWFRYYSDYTL